LSETSGVSSNGPAMNEAKAFLRCRGEVICRVNYEYFRWYARPNDLIGGYCVMPVDEPPSSGIPEVADFMDEHTAQHVAKLHNDWLDRMSDVAAGIERS
jgi:hypothetical protein